MTADPLPATTTEPPAPGRGLKRGTLGLGARW